MASLELPPDHRAAKRARHFVAQTLSSWGLDDAIPDAELLVSELVTNAVLHARSPAVVNVEHSARALRVAVCDDNPSPPRLRDYGREAVTGRGMLLVDRIASRWGVDVDGDGKCVWFEMLIAADGQAQLPA